MSQEVSDLLLIGTSGSVRQAQVERELRRLKAVEDGTLLDEPEERDCRDCGQPFRTRNPRRGTKWGALCPSCLQYEL